MSPKVTTDAGSVRNWSASGSNESKLTTTLRARLRRDNTLLFCSSDCKRHEYSSNVSAAAKIKLLLEMIATKFVITA